MILIWRFCYFILFQQIRLSWSKEDGQLPPSNRARDTGSGDLYITSAEPSDSGVYICTATDGYSSFSDKKILRIEGTNLGFPNFLKSV